MQQRITINLNTDSKTTDKTTILEYCRSHGIAGIETPCGGKGTCGKCKVTVTKPYYKDVLACQTKICDGMEIIVGRKESTGTKEDCMVVLTNGGNVSEKFNEHVNRNVVFKEETANESEKVESNEDTLAACDIGTTTVVCYLIDKETGQIISTRSGANPQRSFGADVLSRIDAAARADDNDKANGGLQMMQTQIVFLLNGWISEMLTECGRTKVSRFSVAGNTGVLTNTPFPFIPIQITLIDACIEAYPSFLTILESDTRRIKGRFLSTAIWNAAPFGIVAAVMIGVTTLFLPMASGEKQTIMYLTLIIISMTAVIRSCIPFNVLRGFICVTMICGTFGALVILPGLFEISAMSVAMWGHFLIGSLTSVAGLLIILNLRGQQEEYKAHMRKKKIKREA